MKVVSVVVLVLISLGACAGFKAQEETLFFTIEPAEGPVAAVDWKYPIIYFEKR